MNHHDILEVQRLDVETAQLLHQRTALQQRQELADAQLEQQDKSTELEEHKLAQIEVMTRQKRYEDEAQIVASKIEADEVRLYSGEISGVRDLQALQQEIASLRNRQGGLEDEALSAMEAAESLAIEVSELSAEVALIEQRIAALTADLGSAEAKIDSQLATIHAAKATLEASLDGKLLADYQRLRPTFGSATVVRFEHGKCVGCPSMMPAMEVDRMKRATSDVLACDECGRIVLL